MDSKMEPIVVIVGAGPAGLATAACLLQHSVSSIILEKEECCASLWKHRSYDRLKLHLAKEFCSLPYMSLPSSAATFVSREDFIQYMDDYVNKFKLEPLYQRFVTSATSEPSNQRWIIEARNEKTDEVEIYICDFLVVATGENSEGVIPEIPGLDTFPGEYIHSSQYRSGAHFQGLKTLVVGCGNSGMEIAYDLWNHGANASIVVRNPFHVLNKEMVYIGMTLLKFFSVSFVDRLIMLLAKIRFGNLKDHGICSPADGPFYLKATIGKSPVVDVGTISVIKSGNIKVNPGIVNINGNVVLFDDGKEDAYDAIVFATGYKSTANNWLKNFDYILNDIGMPKRSFPNHWKGENNLYCAGLSRRGLPGIFKDAEAIAIDIKIKAKLIKQKMV